MRPMKGFPVQEIMSLAADLGKRIAAHERFLKLRAAETTVDADEDTRQLVRRMEEQRAKIAELEARQQPVEPAEKRKLQEMADAVHSNAKLQELARAQADYMELMERVNGAIRKALEAPEDA